MISRLPPEIEPAAPPAPRGDDAGAMLESWLGMLVKLLRLPGPEARSIRDELEAHIRERVRDLMISGCDEGEAMRRAIAELGEAAGLAQSFRSARRSGTRRLAMHMAILGLAGGAAILSLVAVTQGPASGGPSASVFQPQPALAELEQVRVDAEFKTGTNLKDVLEFLAEKAGGSTQVLWPQLEAADVHPELSVSVRAKGATIPVILSLVNESIGKHGGSQLEIGNVDGILSIGPREFFDRRDAAVVSYDLSAPIAARMATYDEEREDVVEDVVRVITEFVSPDDWQANGGDLAQLTVVGDRLFVRAPQRMHPQIKWIISQLPTEATPRAGAGATTVHPLRHSSAQEVAAALQAQFPDWTIQADRRTNSLIVSRPADRGGPAAAIQSLDVPPGRPQGRGPAAPAGRSSKAYPVERLHPVNVLQMLVEAWGERGWLEGPVEMKTDAGTLTISGGEADVRELDRLISFLSRDRRPQTPMDADREVQNPAR